MITWKLWSALESPFYSTLYERILRQKYQSPAIDLGQILNNAHSQLGLMLLSGLSLFYLFQGNWHLVDAALRLLPLPLLVSGIFCGLLCTVSVSRGISEELKLGHFELVSITPLGAVGASWAICHQSYRESKAIYYVKRAPLVMYGLFLTMILFFMMLVVMLWIFLLASGSEQYEPAEFASIWFAIALITSVLGALYTDLLQSVSLGCIIGMLSSTYTHNVKDANGLSIALYLLIQIFYYTAMLLICLVLIPTLYHIFRLPPGVEYPVLLFTVFATSREYLIVQLWRALANRLYSTEHELRKAVGI